MPDESLESGEARAESAQQDFLATLPAEGGERRLALAIALVSAVFFLAFVPYAKLPMGQVWAFIPVYESALVICDLITALLLFGQYGFLRSRALVVLACAYLFTALMTVIHALSFPGLFAPAGLLGAGPQTTVWLYIFWHAGFPLLVAVYALLPRPGEAGMPRHAWNRGGRACARHMVALGVTATCVAVALLGLLATVGHDLLPPLLVARRYSMTMQGVTAAIWALSMVTLVLLWRRRPHSVIDLWLMVVMCAWIADVALSALFNEVRFDLGFYAGRIYGLLAASFVLMVLLIDNGRLYANLVRAHDRERRARRRELDRAAELRAANQELDAFSYSVSHDLRAPLRTVDGYARILQEDYAEKLDAEGQRLLGVVRDGSRKMSGLIDDLLRFSRLGRSPILTRQVQLEDLVRQTIEDLRADYAGRAIEFSIGALGEVQADPVLLQHAIGNLLGNAIKYTRNKPATRIQIGRLPGARPGAPDVYFVKDNGAGFDMRYSSKLFGVFQRLHSDHEYEGTGVGLAIVQRVVSRHGGRIWADARLGEGAAFYFTLAPEPEMPAEQIEEPQAPAQTARQGSSQHH